MNVPVDDRQSEITIYQNAVQKRISSSSEDDGLDLSDESNLFNNLVLDVNERAGSTDQLPAASKQPFATERETTLEEQGEHMVRLSEKAKANMLPPQGKELQNDLNKWTDIDNNFKFVAQMDQDYIVVRAHVDEGLQQWIVQGQYMVFCRLLPKDKILVEDDGRMELIVRDGKTYWMPAVASEVVAITNFSKWEQAFRVYSSIYLKAHPEHAGQLIEYNHIIHSVALSFAWENVYAYDKDFRLHLSCHPDRNWAIILQ